jgi:DNA polymerase I-like protein with 3'-5' exonuclease and polymerase domains
MKCRITLDIETNSALDTIWGCVTEDHNTGETLVHTTPETLKPVLKSADEVVGHNLIGFDAPKLKEIWDVTIKRSQAVDTLVMSRLINPVIEGGHSLRAWGVRLGGDGKIEFSDYDGGWTDEMEKYCIQDVKLTTKLYKELCAHYAKWKDPEKAIRLAHDIFIETCKQERNGFRLDLPKAQMLHATLSDRMAVIETELQEIFEPIVEERWSEKTGKRLKDRVTPFNVGSRKQIAERLQSLGWVPSNFTEKGQAIVDETTLESVEIAEAKVIAEYLMLQKRVGLIDSWLKHVDENDFRVHGRLIPYGTITGRASHHSPNLGQVPSVKKPYGKECRELFTVDQGNKLVGTDLSGIELRCLAHYMQDEEWTEELLNGDVHQKNADAAGITRDQAKTLIYATLYGAGAAKIGGIVGGGSKEGQEVLNRFYRNTPKLKQLMEKVTKVANKGYVPGLDGRRIPIRSEHAALNSLLQGCGATIASQWCVEANKELRKRRLDVRQVAFVHDEIQIESPASVAEEVAEVMVQTALRAGEVLGFRVPVDAESKIGNNWYECH